jgi:hypothetical protein
MTTKQSASVLRILRAGLENAEAVQADGNYSQDWLVGYRMALEGAILAIEAALTSETRREGKEPYGCMVKSQNGTWVFHEWQHFIECRFPDGTEIEKLYTHPAPNLSDPKLIEGGKHGWVYFNPDSGEEYSPNHPIDSGEYVDAEDVRPATAQEEHLYGLWQREFQRAEDLALSPAEGNVGELMGLIERLNPAVRAGDAVQMASELDDLCIEAAQAPSSLQVERDEALPWKLFYKDGLSLGEIAERLGGTVYTYSPWLTAPLVRAALEGGEKATARAEAAEAKVATLESELLIHERGEDEGYQKTLQELAETEAALEASQAQVASLRDKLHKISLAGDDNAAPAADIVRSMVRTAHSALSTKEGE